MKFSNHRYSILSVIVAFVAGIAVAAVNPAWFSFLSHDKTPSNAVSIPEDALVMASDPASGVAIYYYDIRDPQNTARDKGYVVDNGKVIATLDLAYDEKFRIAKIDQKHIVLERGNNELPVNGGFSGQAYEISREDGGVFAASLDEIMNYPF